MEQLKETAFNNLQILVDLKDTETITCHRREIHKQDEYVQIDNISELEYALFFTIHYLLTMEYDGNINRNDLLDDIDLAIDNIYKNKNISKIAEENDVFWDLMKSIDNQYDIIKENFNKSLCNIIFDRFIEYTKVISYFMKKSHLVLHEYHQHIHPGFITDDEEDDDEGQEQEEQLEQVEQLEQAEQLEGEKEE
tara:strand:+ start:35 stop:616 length:582 start_codon:yes stop_codon:yes gene_type:complete